MRADTRLTVIAEDVVDQRRGYGRPIGARRAARALRPERRLRPQAWMPGSPVVRVVVAVMHDRVLQHEVRDPGSKEPSRFDRVEGDVRSVGEVWMAAADIEAALDVDVLECEIGG